MHRHMVVLGLISVLALFATSCGSDSASPSAADIASIEVTFTGNTVSIGAVQSMALAFLDKSGHVIPGTHTAAWTSSNPAIASVDDAGNVRGVALGGPVTITANASGKSVSTSLSVIPAAVVFAPIVTTLLVGTSTHLTAVAQDASQLPIAGGPATWSVSPSSVATVDSTGVVTALASGTITVSATIAGRVGTTLILAGVPSAYDGTWAGPMPFTFSTQDAAVQFTVIYGTVKNFVVSAYPYCFSGRTTIAVAGSQVISSNQFFLIGQGSGQITDIHGPLLVHSGVAISGAFADLGTMSGSVEPGASAEFGPYVCPSGAPGNFNFSNNAFSATKQ